MQDEIGHIRWAFIGSLRIQSWMETFKNVSSTPHHQLTVIPARNSLCRSGTRIPGMPRRSRFCTIPNTFRVLCIVVVATFYPCLVKPIGRCTRVQFRLGDFIVWREVGLKLSRKLGTDNYADLGQTYLEYQPRQHPTTDYL
jgi:hypothetical protein